MMKLNDRAIVRISGEDRFSFLQNLITQDMHLIANDQRLIYTCLLSPQGNILHDFFVFKDNAGDYLIDCAAGQHDTFVRRLSMYKLRAKVDILHAETMHVYSAIPDEFAGPFLFQDPRLPQLGHRLYTDVLQPDNTLGIYDDRLISLGVPPTSAIRYEKDYMSDVNLDLLHAISFEKGCFVGQEIAARIYHRGLVKRRLFIINGDHLSSDADGMRCLNSNATKGLILARVEDAANSGLITPSYV